MPPIRLFIDTNPPSKTRNFGKILTIDLFPQSDLPLPPKNNVEFTQRMRKRIKIGE
jgi:hypothetical protein